MLEFIRQRIKSIVVWTIIVLIGIAFAFSGLSDYFSMGGGQKIAAKVNGEKLSWQAVEALYERVQGQFGDNVDSLAIKNQMRLGLARRMALLSAAKKLGFKVGDLQIAEMLIQIPVFQVDGKFSKERYLEVLQDAAYTDAGFRQELAQDVLLGQLEQGLALSSFTLPSELSRIIELSEQKRDIGYVVIPQQKFKSGINVSKEDTRAYFDANPASFVKPEQVAIEYVELSVEELGKQLQVTEDEISKYYTAHQDSYGAPERVHARHILIAAPQKTQDKAAAEADAKAKEQAEALLAKIKSGSDFAALAKENSADNGSAEKGGDLGWFTKGQMVPEFEKAIFALHKPDDLAGPVRTTYGYHIIQLIEHKPAETRTLKEVKDLVKEQVQREKGQEIFIEKGENMAKIAFEQASSLQPIADALNLKIKETELFSRQGGSEKLTNHPRLLQTAFNEEILKGNNSEPLKLDDNTLLVFRLKTHVAAKQQTLEEVEKQIQDRLVSERSALKARELAESLVKSIRAGQSPSTLAKDHGLTWITKTGITRSTKDLDKNIVVSAFMAPRPESATVPGLKISGMAKGDPLVIAITAVHPGDIAKFDEKLRQDYRQSLADLMAQFEFHLYAKRTLDQAKIELTQ